MGRVKEYFFPEGEWPDPYPNGPEDDGPGSLEEARAFGAECAAQEVRCVMCAELYPVSATRYVEGVGETCCDACEDAAKREAAGYP